jgi:hypothetical protein
MIPAVTISDAAFTHDVFLSKSAKDKAAVRDVAERLRKPRPMRLRSSWSGMKQIGSRGVSGMSAGFDDAVKGDSNRDAGLDNGGFIGRGTVNVNRRESRHITTSETHAKDTHTSIRMNPLECEASREPVLAARLISADMAGSSISRGIGKFPNAIPGRVWCRAD